MNIFERMLAAPSKKTIGLEKKSVPKKAQHLMIRFSDHLGKNTIDEHQIIVDKMGYVWFGKIGKTISQSFIESSNKSGEPIFAFFVKTTKKKVTVYRSTIKAITKDDLRNTPEIKHVPDYVATLPVDFGFWLKIDSFKEMPNSIIADLIVCRSRSRLAESLCSTAGVMFVEFE